MSGARHAAHTHPHSSPFATSLIPTIIPVANMPKSNLSAIAISSAPVAECDTSIDPDAAQNHGKPGGTVFAGENELLAIRKWLEHDHSMSTSWLVVRALVDESLKKVSRSGDLRRFTDAELRDAAGVDEFEWRNVRTWWMKRRDDARTFLRSENQDGVLLDMERFPGGGRGITASTGIVVRKPEGALADQREDEEEDAGASGPVRYAPRNADSIRLSGPWRRWLFSAGEIEVGSTRHALLRWRVMTPAIFILLLSVVFFVDLVLRNRPIETQNLAYLLGIVVIGKFWWQEWRPIYHARLDRITALPEEWLTDDELPTQLERKRTRSGEVLRLVRYQAACPICGADVHLGEGVPSDPRRVLGRCIDAPREHVFTFDPVSHDGRHVRNERPGVS